MSVRQGEITNRRSDTCLDLNISKNFTPASNTLSLRIRTKTERSRKSSTQNVPSSAMARPSMCAVVETTSCTRARSLLGRVACSNGRMIFGCLVVWGYCLTSCLGLLMSPEPYPTGMNKPRDHAGGIITTKSHHDYRHGGPTNDAQRASDSEPYTKSQSDIGAFGKNSKVFLPVYLIPFSKESEVFLQARRFEKSDRNIKTSEAQTLPKSYMPQYLDPSLLKAKKDSLASQHTWSRESLGFASQPPKPFHEQPSSKDFPNSQDNTYSNTLELPSRGRNAQSLDFHHRDSSNHINVDSTILTKIASLTNISKKLGDAKKKQGHTHHKIFSIDKSSTKSDSKKIHKKISLSRERISANSEEYNRDLNRRLQDKSLSEEILPFLIQETVQKMQSRLEYLTSLTDDLNDHFEDEDGRDTERQAIKTEDLVIPAYLYSNNHTNPTQIPAKPLASKRGHLPQYKSFGKNNDAPNKDNPGKLQDQRNAEDGMLERDVMSAVVTALARGKVPEDMYFWRNVSRFLDSNAYLSRTRRSSYRSRYLRRRRLYSRNSSRYMARLRGMASIHYNHVRPCLRRDRYYCMNRGTCVFVAALDIKTCR